MADNFKANPLLRTTEVLRPLGGIENEFAVMHDAGVNVTAFTTWVKSKQFLSYDVWGLGLKRLQEAIPQLRLTIVWQDGKRYFKYMDEPRADFEVLDIASCNEWKKVHEDMMCLMFDTTNGPLWRVKILRMPGDNTQIDLGKEGCSSTKGDSWFNSAVVFGVHHSILDGISTFIMSKKLIGILNAYLAGKPREDDDAMKFLPSLEKLLPKDKMAFGWRDYFQVTKMKYKELFPTEGLFSKRFLKASAPSEGCTKIVAVQFSFPETLRIIAKCKDRGVTVQGVLFAAASMAVAKLINEGQSPQMLKIASTHAVNMRRFLSPELNNTTGSLAIPLDIPLMTPTASTYAGFWELVKRATQVIHASLNNGDVIRDAKISSHLFSDSRVKRMVSNRGCTSDICTSNLGDCDRLWPPETKGDLIHATRLVSSSAIHKVQAPFFHYLQKFRGCFCYNLAYGTNRVTESNATRYAEMTVKLMKMASGKEDDWKVMEYQ